MDFGVQFWTYLCALRCVHGSFCIKFIYSLHTNINLACIFPLNRCTSVMYEGETLEIFPTLQFYSFWSASALLRIDDWKNRRQCVRRAAVPLHNKVKEDRDAKFCEIFGRFQAALFRDRQFCEQRLRTRDHRQTHGGFVQFCPKKHSSFVF